MEYEGVALFYFANYSFHEIIHNRSKVRLQTIALRIHQIFPFFPHYIQSMVVAAGTKVAVIRRDLLISDISTVSLLVFFVAFLYEMEKPDPLAMPKFTLSKFNNKHFLALASNGIIAVMAFVQMGFIYRKMEMDDVGRWFFFLSIVGIAESIRSGFLGTATIKFYAGTEPKRGATVLGSVWDLALAITGALALADAGLLTFLKFIHDKELALATKWFGITIISSLPYTLTFWILMADERYDKILWLKLVNNGSMLLTIIVCVLMHKMTLEALLWINFLTNILTSLVALVFGFSQVKTITHRTRDCILEIFHFGKFNVGTTFIANLLNNVDVFVLKFMLGPTAVAIYNIPLKFMQLVEIPLRSFAGTGMSGMAIAYNNNNIGRVKYILTKYSGMIAIAFIPMAVVTFFVADQAIYLIGGAKYAGTEAANLFRLFMLFSVLSPIDRFNGVTLDVIHKPDVNLYKTILMLVVNVSADFIGITIFKNMYGVAFGSISTVLAGLIFGYFMLRKYISYTLGEIVSTGYREMKLFIGKWLAMIIR